MKKNLRIGTILAISAALLWAVNIIITKFILRAGENPINIIFWITLFALPFWLGLFLRKRQEAAKITKKDIWILLAIGIISTLFIAVVEAFAIKYTPAINYSFLIRSTLLFTIGFAAIFLGEKITLKKIILGVLILLGAYLVATGGKVISLSVGDGLTLLEAALIAFGNTILGKIATKTMSSQLSSSGSFMFGLLPVIAITFLTKSFAFPHTIPLLILLSLLGVISSSIRFRAYEHCSASFLAMTYSLTPVFVSIIAFFLLGERLTPIQLIGGLLVVSGGVFAEKIKL
ncbi:MAG: DMT family transporter [Patescibacteria group bacterium]